MADFRILLVMFMVGFGVFLACKEDASGENALCGGLIGCFAAIPVLVVADVVSRIV